MSSIPDAADTSTASAQVKVSYATALGATAPNIPDPRACNLPAALHTAIGKAIPFVPMEVMKVNETQMLSYFRRSKFWAITANDYYQDAKAALVGDKMAVRVCAQRATKIFFVTSAGFKPLYIFDTIAEKVQGAILTRVTTLGKPQGTSQGVIRFSSDKTEKEFEDWVETHGEGQIYAQKVHNPKDKTIAYNVYCSKEKQNLLRRLGFVMDYGRIQSSSHSATQATVRVKKEAEERIREKLYKYIWESTEVDTYVKNGVYRIASSSVEELKRISTELKQMSEWIQVIPDDTPPKSNDFKTWSETYSPPPPPKTWCLASGVPIAPPIFEECAQLIGAKVNDRKWSFFCAQVSWGDPAVQAKWTAGLNEKEMSTIDPKFKGIVLKLWRF